MPPVFDTMGIEPPALSPEQEIRAYRDMLLVRRFEEKAGQLYGMGHIGGFCHLCIGQEAVVVGLRLAAGSDDELIATYRHHGHMLAAGMDPRAVMAELAGRAGGASKGKGGSMHMFSRAHRYYGGHGIVGANVPLGAGLAFAIAYRGGGGICWCSLGDCAVDQGQVYETLNLAARWSLPLVLVIENNACAGGGGEPDAGRSLAQRGGAFAIPGEKADGMDVRAVKAAAERAASHARSGAGPYLLELSTMRYRGHSMSNPGRYRSREEAAAAREATDPIEMAKGRLLRAALTSEVQLKAIDREVRAIVQGAAEHAMSDAEPDARELLTDVLL